MYETDLLLHTSYIWPHSLKQNRSYGPAERSGVPAFKSLAALKPWPTQEVPLGNESGSEWLYKGTAFCDYRRALERNTLIMESELLINAKRNNRAGSEMSALLTQNPILASAQVAQV